MPRRISTEELKERCTKKLIHPPKLTHDQITALCFVAETLEAEGKCRCVQDEPPCRHCTALVDLSESGIHLGRQADVERDYCSICGCSLNNPADPVRSQDCGGDCLKCMAESGDTDCIEAMEEVQND